MTAKEESEKAGVKLNIQKTKIMASSPITSWQIEEGKLDVVTDFIFLGSKITADGDCSHEIKRRFLLCRDPAPADPGYSKERRHRRGLGNNCLIKR